MSRRKVTMQALYDLHVKRGDKWLGRTFTAGEVYVWHEWAYGDWMTTNDAGGPHLGSPEWIKKNFRRVEHGNRENDVGYRHVGAAEAGG